MHLSPGLPMQEGATVKRPAVSEVYSPPRVTKTARRLGLKAGWALDLRTVDEHGRNWDFSRPDRRKEALCLVRSSQPKMLIGSPMCTAFSQLQALNRSKLGEEKWKLMIEDATRHIIFCSVLYREQMSRGDYFLHEHPAGASSWRLPCMIRLASMPGVRRVVGNMCAHGMWQVDSEGPALVKKPTGFLTNSAKVAERVSARCSGGHRHVHLVNGRARQAQEYPEGLCVAICEGLREQLRADESRRNKDEVNKEILASIREHTRKASKAKSDGAVGELNCLMHSPDGQDAPEPSGEDLLSTSVDDETWDDVRGGWLSPQLVAAARQEEMKYIKKHTVYVRVPRAQCWSETGKPPVKTGWTDTNKGTDVEPNVRSRWVAKEFNTGPRPDLFAGTAPLEGVKLVLSQAASERDGDVCVGIVDVRRAYFYAGAKRRVFVELPVEDWQPGDEDKCGLLRASLYGTRDAAQNWGEELGATMSQLGFRKGKASPCLYYAARRRLCAAVHGDDITLKGPRKEVEKFMNDISKIYETKTQIMGGDPDMPKSVKVLNRTISWTTAGLWVEADPRHVSEVIKALGLEKANVAPTPYARPDEEKNRGRAQEEEELSKGEATQYRAVAARLNYLSLDRPDIRHAVTVACAAMSRPTGRDWTALKRIGRFLKGKPRAAALYAWQKTPGCVTAYSDSDWAGDKATRRSMSGGCIYHGNHVIKFWAKGQQVVALSSAEAELYAGTRAATEAIGAQSIMNDLGTETRVVLGMDSSAALALNQREGLGKAKHICIQELWMQDAIKQKKLTLNKVPGEHNPADLFTKGLSADRTAYLMKLLNFHYL